MHWVVLHTPLTVVQRSQHSYDSFLDNGRVLPWGTCYNYVDLQFRNDTKSTFQLQTRVGDKYLEREIRADEGLPHSYEVFARNEEFIQSEENWFRRNEI